METDVKHDHKLMANAWEGGREVEGTGLSIGTWLDHNVSACILFTLVTEKLLHGILEDKLYILRKS
jgi:hypothetical protein